MSQYGTAKLLRVADRQLKLARTGWAWCFRISRTDPGHQAKPALPARRISCRAAGRCGRCGLEWCRCSNMLSSAPSRRRAATARRPRLRRTNQDDRTPRVRLGCWVLDETEPEFTDVPCGLADDDEQCHHDPFSRRGRLAYSMCSARPVMRLVPFSRGSHCREPQRQGPVTARLRPRRRAP